MAAASGGKIIRVEALVRIPDTRGAVTMAGARDGEVVIGGAGAR
jgi:hypothetical protein